MMRPLVLVFLWLPGVLFANDWDALKQPDAIAIMRHALAPGTGDPSGFSLYDCATQRNLDARGQAQARKIGNAIRVRGIVFDLVLTSQWCRTRETAELLDLGPVTDAPALNSFFGDYESRTPQTRDTLALIDAAKGRLMLVTHQVNISALTGGGARSGEVVVFRMKDGAPEVTGRILIDP